MDCDQVFMILTRGPFPTGEPWDELVESHLETCADCWRLAEALRPALEVFQEAVPPAESRDLPGYWGDARPAAAIVAQLTKPLVRPVVAGDRGHSAVASRGDRLDAGRSSSLDLFRAAALASVLTAAVIGLALFWWG